jgi:hypothetical protein
MTQERPKFRPQTSWETRSAQNDLIGRSVEVPGAEGFGTSGCGYGDIIAFRRTNHGPQVKVRRLYGQGVEIHFLNAVRASGLPEATAEQF